MEPHIEPPEYIKERPILDIHSGLTRSEEEGKVDVLEAWPKSPTGDLDETQWAALEQILTKKLSIIQGPPGTGKKFVSVVALRGSAYIYCSPDKSCVGPASDPHFKFRDKLHPFGSEKQ